MRPVGGGGVHGIHLIGDLFAQLAVGFASGDIDGLAPGHLIRPRAENRVGREPSRLARQNPGVAESGELQKMPG